MRGRKISTRPRWLTAAVVGTITFLVVTVLSVNWDGGTRPAVKTATKTVQSNVATMKTGDEIDRGYRGYAITFEPGNPGPSAVSSGDRVDVIAAFPTSPDEAPRAITVVARALIVRVDKDQRTVTLAVTPSDAEKLAFAQTNGQIKLALCPLGPDTATAGRGATFEDM